MPPVRRDCRSSASRWWFILLKENGKKIKKGKSAARRRWDDFGEQTLAESAPGSRKTIYFSPPAARGCFGEGWGQWCPQVTVTGGNGKGSGASQFGSENPPVLTRDHELGPNLKQPLPEIKLKKHRNRLQLLPGVPVGSLRGLFCWGFFTS